MDLLSIVIGLIKSMKLITVESGTIGTDSGGVFVVVEENNE